MAGKGWMCLSHNMTKRKGFLRPLQGHEVSHCTKFLFRCFIYSQNQKIVDGIAIYFRKFISKFLSAAEENLKWKALKIRGI